MSWIHNYQITGIIAALLGSLSLLWLVVGTKTKAGGVGLITLSMMLMNFGGGFIGPMIGIAGGIPALFAHR